MDLFLLKDPEGIAATSRLLLAYLPAQIIDGNGGSGMVCGRVFTAVPGGGLLNGMIIRAVFFM